MTKERPPAKQPGATTKADSGATTSSPIVRDRAGIRRRLRLRRREARELDMLCGLLRSLADRNPEEYAAHGLTLGVPERERAGAELAAAGWSG